ncbi:hypothetical protein GCM10009547_41960 [Sporichthya brevicatena]|uniref:TrwC relaxase domain-containing protein n=2 Tax=Sporichthya brevicatena TaxID=171442 RepID=A0ABN1H901_9ACTN
MSAGSGYRYLLRQTASNDVVRVPGQELVAYYAASGNPPGTWIGAGLPGLGTGDGQDLPAGTTVTEEAMGRLFGSGHDPVTGERLGLAYPKFRTAAERIATHVARLPADLPELELIASVAAIESQEQARPVRTAVAGYDLTFTVPKSVSVLWAIGDQDVRHAVEGAHRDAVAAVLGVIEDRFLHTRIGDGSKIRVPARGAIAAAFDHYDTRAGDPNLHTHLVVANKVQGPDGRWRAVDGQVLFRAAVACSEIYDSTIADLLAAHLPVTFGYRDRGPRRTPAYEIEGIPDALLEAFSSRAAAITAHTQDLVATFTDSHGREPTRAEVLKLRQQATLATRPDKDIAPLAELRSRWAATAEAVTGTPVDAIVRDALTSANAGRASIVTTAPAIAATFPAAAGSDTAGVAEIPEVLLGRYAEATVAALAQRRATWTATNLLAEAARTTRALRQPSPGARMALLDAVVSAALDRCVALDPPAATTTPAHYIQHEMHGATAAAPEPAYSSWKVLAAEARLLDAHNDHMSAPVADTQSIEALAAARPLPGRPRLSAEQARAAVGIAASGRRLDLLLGPAGTGKTRALCALRAGWEHTHGAGTVIGLAPSAAAAAVLGASVGIDADTLAKWIHESGPATASGQAWQLRPGQLVIVDEAAMAPTAQLDLLVSQAVAAGAKVVAVGDQFQLGAVDAGGAFALLADEGHPVELERLHRFSEAWEAEATRQLRLGDPACLDAYAAHDRLHDGPVEAMVEKAYRAWADDCALGRDSVLLAIDRETVRALNDRARCDRIRWGVVDTQGEVSLHDGSRAGLGDVVVTRRNDRAIPSAGAHVRNGDRWRVTRVHTDGSLDAVPLGGDRGVAPELVRLPATYVRRDVELGYASTIHRAQGRTADSAHIVVGPGIGREPLYVGMTRGREANHAYVARDVGLGDTPEMTVRQVMSDILARRTVEPAATAELRRRWEQRIEASATTGLHAPHATDAQMRFRPSAPTGRRQPMQISHLDHEGPTRGGP